MGKTKANIIQVSFKATKKEQLLLDIINSKEEKSQFIKDALNYYIRYLHDEYEGDEE